MTEKSRSVPVACLRFHAANREKKYVRLSTNKYYFNVGFTAGRLEIVFALFDRGLSYYSDQTHVLFSNHLGFS